MLVTFRSQAWNSVTLFGEIAERLLKMMGHSGTVPSAIRGSDVRGALVNLRRGLAALPKETRKDTDEDEKEPPVPLQNRAYPLIELLEASAKEEADVTWDEGVPVP